MCKSAQSLQRIIVAKDKSPLLGELRKLFVQTGRKAYKLSWDPSKPTSVYDSKVGGIMYWDPDVPWPLDNNGYSLRCMCQLNCGDLGFEFPLPVEGMLQFFIEIDAVTGIPAYKPEAKGSFKVVYHRGLKKGVTVDMVEEIFHEHKVNRRYHSPTKWGPVNGECGLRADKFLSVRRSNSYCLPVLQEYCQQHHLPHPESFKEALAILDLDIFELIELDQRLVRKEDRRRNHFGEYSHTNLLGYPFYTEDDPLEGEEQTEQREYYDTLLLSLDSESWDQGSLVLGDSGIANFMINSSRLYRRDFSDVYFYWDCY